MTSTRLSPRSASPSSARGPTRSPPVTPSSNMAASKSQSEFLFSGGLMGKNKMPLIPNPSMTANTFNFGFVGV